MLLCTCGQLRAESDVSCYVEEPWGFSEFVANGTSGFQLFVRLSASDSSRPARFIATPPGVTLCIVVEHALVYVAPGDGIYQVERGLDQSSSSLWIAEVPHHYSDESVFRWDGELLHLVTGPLSTAMNVEFTMLNNPVPELHAERELEYLPEVETAEPAVSVYLGEQMLDIYDSFAVAMQKQSAYVSKRGELVVSSSKGPMQLAVRKPFSGHCVGAHHVFGFDDSGGVWRFDRDAQVLNKVGEFRLSSPVRQCLVDHERRRLYVLTAGQVFWVFDLSRPGLGMPRGVTNEYIVEELNGLGLYGSEYIVTQSSGDQAFLVFSSEMMQLVARFRIAANVSEGIDGIAEAARFAAVREPLFGLPKGGLIVHDNYNRLPEAEENLKLIDWRAVEKLIDNSLR